MSDTAELLTGQGLLLRPWRPDDAPAVLRAFAPAEMARQAARPVTTTAEASEWIADRDDERAAGSGYSWAVVREGVALGSVAVTSVNHVHDTGWVSYWTTEAARGTGVASSGLRALVEAGPSAISGSTGWSSDTGRTTLPPAPSPCGPASPRRESSGTSSATGMSATTWSATHSSPPMMSTLIDME